MAEELIKVGRRVKIPDYMRDYAVIGGKGEMTGVVRGMDDTGECYAVEFDGKQMSVGHVCLKLNGIQLVPSARGWWFQKNPPRGDQALMPIDTSPFLMAVADYVSREMGRT